MKIHIDKLDVLFSQCIDKRHIKGVQLDMLKKLNMIKRTYYLSRILIDKIEARSNLTGLSTADIVRLALAEYLKKD
jgi:hypothetical protein